MEKINLHYSEKNIPTASNKNYKMQLIDKIEAVIKRMRWKAIFFETTNGDQEEEAYPETYGLKTTNTPQQVPEMADFEKELIGVIRKLKFRNHTNDFQKHLQEDIRAINNSDKMYVHADKTSNIYKLDKQEYNRLLNNSITKTYQKTNNEVKQAVNYAGKTILKDHHIADRVDINGENNCFITLKDHKENFANNPTTRLINPAKNELGRISKAILEKMNKQLRTSLNLNQWKSTSSVIEWFTNIAEKNKHKFMMFDVKDFYPSITEKLLTNALKFAERILCINEKEKQIISHARKSLLFNNGESWIKQGNKLFDVTMGAYDGAEVCELVGCFILSDLSSKYNKENIGLYRDDGLAIFKNISGPQSEKIKKAFQKAFKKFDLEIVIQCNMKIVDYLDVTFDLNTGTYKPYHKPDGETNYVHVKSNHPPNIIKQIPISIQNRLSNLSANEEIFQQAIPHYSAALERSGYNHNFEYKPTAKNRVRNNRKRNIIWFNPPFNNNTATNIGRVFLNLVKKHFPRQHKFHKIFNKNNVKVSYSCMPNIKSKIDAHNKRILTSTNADIDRTCNCSRNTICPLDNNCLTKSIVYEATISSNLQDYEPKKYIGLCEGTFKKRFSGHKSSFNLERYQHSTALSTEAWRIRENDGVPNITWRIIRKEKAYTPETRRCMLCLAEKFEIANYPDDNILNKRTEIIAKCRHRRKHLLSSFDSVT